MLEHIPKKRRTVLKGMLATSVAAFTAPILYVVAKYLTFTGGSGDANAVAKMSAADLTPDAPAKYVQINGEPIIVVREADNQIRAFTATCTHLGCTVSYKPVLPGSTPPMEGFYCKCHHGKYDAAGKNIKGTPPPRPLTELSFTQDGEDLVISLKPKV
jgi:Rieske Fe-S protein